MTERRRRGTGRWVVIGVVFATVFAIGFIGVQWVTKTGIFKVPGVVVYDESITEAEQEWIAEAFTGVELKNDVRVSAEWSLARPTGVAGRYIGAIYVPVAGFYSTQTELTVENAEWLLVGAENGQEIAENGFTGENGTIKTDVGTINEVVDVGYALVSLDELDFAQKLLAVNGEYYLESFEKGAVWRVITFGSEKFEEEVEPLVARLGWAEGLESSEVLTMAQTGVTALSRGMNEKLAEVGDAEYFAAEIGKFLSGFDITHTSNEASFSEYASDSNICADPRFISTLTAIGLDVVELTGNHNLDCGDEAAIETLEIYEQNGIKTVGGGATVAEAAESLTLSQKGTVVTMLAYNESTGGATYDATPGANQYYEEVARAQIAEAKARGEVVIVDVQYYECGMYVSEVEDTTCDYADSAAGDQVGLFRELIDMGADVVVGTSAHQPQTYELYGEGEIYYGLGNLFFDQVWWPGTTRSLVLVHYIHNGRILQTRVVPTQYGEEMQPAVMESTAAAVFLQRLEQARPEPVGSEANTSALDMSGMDAELQAVVEEWARGKTASVMVYDLDKDTLLASWEAGEEHNMASLYKLFVVYEGYRRVAAGEWQGSDMVSGTEHTVLECLDLAIRESDSLCAEGTLAMIGYDEIDQIASKLGAKNTSVSGVVSTATDVLVMMRRFYAHPDFSEAGLVAQMWDSFLNQPVTEYDWRQGLPSGFSDNAKVYNKVGWNWDGQRWEVYNDAAIVELPYGRHVAVVVMTSYADNTEIARLGGAIERCVEGVQC